MGLASCYLWNWSKKLQFNVTHGKKGHPKAKSKKREIYDERRSIEQNEEIFQRVGLFWDDSEDCD